MLLQRAFAKALCNVSVVGEPTMTSYDRNTNESLSSDSLSNTGLQSGLLWCATIGLFLVFVIAVLMTVSGPPELLVGAVPP